MLPLRILSTGKALPSQCVSAAQLDLQLGHAAGYSLKKGGVRERYFAPPTLSQSQLGAQALQDAVQRAGVPLGSIDLLIGACGVQEQALPSTACLIAHHAQLPAGTPAIDVNASCLSFVMALQMAASLLASNTYQRIAIVSADLPSRGVDWSEPEASLIFGDGAAAAIVERGTAQQGIRSFHMATYPQGRTFCEIRAGGTQRNPRTHAQAADYLFHMDGKAVFKLATQVIPDFLSTLMQPIAEGADSIDWVVPHQASHLGMAHAAKRLKMAASRIVNIYETHGNQVAASIPTALHEVLRSGRAHAGHRLLLVGTAAGLSVGGLVLDL